MKIMGSKKRESSIREGAEYRHVEGLRYRVDTILIDATGYESGAELPTYILYTQLDAGSFPEGTQWVREEQDFIKNFELISD